MNSLVIPRNHLRVVLMLATSAFGVQPHQDVVLVHEERRVVLEFWRDIIRRAANVVVCQRWHVMICNDCVEKGGKRDANEAPASVTPSSRARKSYIEWNKKRRSKHMGLSMWVFSSNARLGALDRGCHCVPLRHPSSSTARTSQHVNPIYRHVGE